MVNVAVMGYGTVGSGVVEVLTTNAEKISRGTADEINVKYILDIRDFPGDPHEDRLTKDFADIENDPTVSVVVETMGGQGVAYDFTKRSLMAGKSVVTSNKELVAAKGWELLNIAKEHKVSYLFEASVGGGIPILRPLANCLAANEITEIYGILNGTTNYILDQMIKNGLAFDTALKQAQANGYAEANPAADIEGADVCRKICILSAVAFGRHVYPDQVPTEGILKVTLDDVAYAGEAGYKIKLLGRAVKGESGKVSAYVAPHLVKEGELLAGVDGVMNGVVVHGNAIGEVMFYGAGAGKLPTASAVVGDVIDAVRHQESRKYLDWAEGGDDVTEDAGLLKSRWYVRTAQSDISAWGDVEKIHDGVFLTGELGGHEAEALAAKCPAEAMFRVLP
jgi:homoserine dehydrogenase